MHVRLELPSARLRRWHRWLIDQLIDRTGAGLSISFSDGEPPVPAAVSLVLTLEALTSSSRRPSGATPLSRRELLSTVGPEQPAINDRAADITLHLGAPGSTPSSGRHITVSYDGSPHEDAMWHALLDRRAPAIGLDVIDGSDDCSLHQAPAHSIHALPGIEAPHVLSQSADAVFSRTIELIVAVMDRLTSGRPTADLQQPFTQVPYAHDDGDATTITRTQSAQFLARRASDKARAKLRKLLRRAPHWQVAWRQRADFQPQADTCLDLLSFQRLKDDGQRYFADPCVVDHGDQTYIFVEEFPYATQRGLISVATLDAAGMATTPKPVLESSVHLSYPHVFAYDGAHWMLPEASASGGVDLYRATSFPDAWIPVARLIDEPLHDATLHFDGVHWWMFAASQYLRSSSWCGLKVFHAPNLMGPWQAASNDALKVDVRCTRPAGPLVTIDNTLWRPTQNCRNGYGHSLTWCRIDILTPRSILETATGSMRFGDSDRHLGPHTWTRSSRFEATDFFGASRR